MNEIKTIEMPTPGKLEVNGKIITFDKDGPCGIPEGELSQSELYSVMLHIGVEFRDVRYCEDDGNLTK
jgi:hypothetical protein